MKNLVIYAFFVIVLIFISGCTSKQESTTLTTIDCGDNTECFANNFRSCTPAKIYEGTTEIKGGTPQSCKIFFAALDDPQLTMECIVKDTDKFENTEMNMNGAYEKGSSCQGSLSDFLDSVYGR
jgi:hypothetical protein|tara:strand:+ start:20885 stop:21256 length:372 start_codon:yes stop_codon:yes gene_type:complete